ncbi:MAG: hypothetical protein ABIJ83_02100 [Patescibacteria group bacterium]
MTNKPSWLPDIISFSDYNSDWNNYLRKLFEIFKNDFIDSRPLYKNKPVLFDNHQINNYPACFWHLITEDKVEDCDRVSEKNISLLRCERVCWIRPVIENHSDSIVSVWENKRKRKINTIFFLEDLDYIVILTNVKNRFYLLTAYYINYSHKKEQIINERDQYLKMQKPPRNGTA